MNRNFDVGVWSTAGWGIPSKSKSLSSDGIKYYEFIACASYATGYSDALQQLILPYYTAIQGRADCSGDFEKFKKEWENDTVIISNLNEIAMHPAYQRIIGMGTTAVPLIICEMAKKPGHWFWALKAITGEDPVPTEARGNIRQMTDLWLDWWEENKERYE